MRPINFISSNDVLPTDKYGRTSMLVSDIVWTPDDLFAVVGFYANYFCVLSRLGSLTKLVVLSSPNPSVQNFFIAPEK